MTIATFVTMNIRVKSAYREVQLPSKFHYECGFNKHVQMIKQKGKGKHLRATEGDDDSEFDIFRPYIIRT